MDEVFPDNPTVHMICYDDWLINVLLSDGRVYTFNTELWPSQREWPDSFSPVVIEEAKAKALDLAKRGVDTWKVESLPENLDQLAEALDFICMHTSYADFRRFIQR